MGSELLWDVRCGGAIWWMLIRGDGRCADRIFSNFSAIVFGSLCARAKPCGWLYLVCMPWCIMELSCVSAVVLRSVLSSNNKVDDLICQFKKAVWLRSKCLTWNCKLPDINMSPIYLCLLCICVFFCFLLHSCRSIVSAVGWTWWDWSLILWTYMYLPSVLWHCWLGHLTRKNPSPIWPIMRLVGR